MPSDPLFSPFIECLRRHRNILVTTHVRPDGDALGTAAAMVLGLQKAGIQATALLLSHLPRKYAFIFTENRIPFVEMAEGIPDTEFRLASSDQSPEDFRAPFDALLVVDTGTWSQLPGVKRLVAGWSAPKYVLDHHLTQEDWADRKLVLTDAAAAGEIAADLLEHWPIPFDHAIASALYLAIVSDTGWFQFSNTRPRTLRMAADLVEAGIDTDQMYQALYQNERKERVALQTRAQQSMRLLSDDRVAVMTIRKSDFDDTGANVPDTENLVNIPLQIATVEVSLLITEPRDAGPVRISLRSKGQLDVAAFAQQFGGGGHARASGLKLAGPLDEVSQKVLTALERAVTGGRP